VYNIDDLESGINYAVKNVSEFAFTLMKPNVISPLPPL
jgi:hypothetical protein